MALHIVRTRARQLANNEVRAALSAALEGTGRALVFASSFDQALRLQHELADAGFPTLGLTVTTPAAWADERWEVYGDGRHLVGDETRVALMRLELDGMAGIELTEEQSPLPQSPGMRKMLCSLAKDALPAIPRTSAGDLDLSAPLARDLTPGERRACQIACNYASRIASRGFAERSEAMVRLPSVLGEAGAVQPPIVCCGIDSLPWATRRMLAELAASTEVTLVVRERGSLADQMAELLVAQLTAQAGALGVTVDMPDGLSEATGAPSEGASDAACDADIDPELAALKAAIFREDAPTISATGAVSLLEPAGPAAQAEALCQQIQDLAAAGAETAVVVTGDVEATWRQLAPKLAARGIAVRAAVRTPVMELPAARAFMGYARTVARLAELDEAWPEPEASDEGPVPQLGDMSWWPPRELTDFLLSDISHMDAPRARALDVRWRGNRMLSPARVLADLQRKSDVSSSVMRATRLMLQGRVGTAAAELARAIVDPSVPPETAAPERKGESPVVPEPRAYDPLRHDRSVTVLATVQQVSRSLAEQGITAVDKGKPDVHPLKLTELVSLLEELLEQEVLMQRLELLPDPAAVDRVAQGGNDGTGTSAASVPAGTHVRICGRSEVVGLPPASADALIACNLTAAEYPLAAPDDALVALEGRLGLGAPTDPLDRARRDFAAALDVPRCRLVLERASHDDNSAPTYPAVVLSECLAVYDVSADKTAKIERTSSLAPLAPRVLGEEHPAAAAAASGREGASAVSERVDTRGIISDASRAMVIVPREGQGELPGGKPSLSASQIESYLECPYKWFTLRRLGLGSHDADFSPVQMGSYAHRVLEVSRRNMALAAAKQAGLLPGDAGYAELSDLPQTYLPGSAVTAQNLEFAHEQVSTEFDYHLRHQRQRATTLNMQSLVPHSQTEELSLERLRTSLLSVMDYERDRLEGFEPRYFELRFGGTREDAVHVDYAGADFVGSVDRVDINAHGVAIVIDYKHKGALGFAKEYDAFPAGCPADAGQFVLPRRVQSLIYAQVIRRMYPQLKVRGAVYLSTRGYDAAGHEIAGALDANVADQVMGALKDTRAAALVCGGPGQMSFEDLLDRTEEEISQAIARMRAGEIQARPCDPQACSYCPVMNCARRLS